MALSLGGAESAVFDTGYLPDGDTEVDVEELELCLEVSFINAYVTTRCSWKEL